MPTLKFQKFMVGRKSQQKRLCISWICSNPDLEKIDKFGWWDLEGISEDTGAQFTLIDFKQEC